MRTDRETDFEDKLKKKTLTSGCAQGTVFGDLMEKFDEVRLDPDAVLRTSWLYALTRKINTAPSLYLAAGAIHGCVLCEEDRPLLYMEDVGRHNAIDKIAGYMHLNGISPAGKIFYTTGRLTSEMVIKTVQMAIPILISRSGFTAWGVELARQAGLTLIGRAKGRRFVALAGAERIVFDGDPAGRRRRAGRGSPARRACARGRGVKVVGLLLAGGLSRRMGGGDKALRLLGGRPLLDHVIERLRPQVAALVLNANGDPARFARFGLPVVRRQRSPISPGRSPACWPGSTGRPPTGRIAILSPASRPTRRFCRPTSWRGSPRASKRRGADLACAASGGQAHPVIGLWPVRLREDLRHARGRGGHPQGRSVDRATSAGHGGVRRTEPDRPVLQRQPARGPRRGRGIARP